MRWRRLLLLTPSLTLLSGVAVGGCDDPCHDVEVKVCDELHDKRRCEVIRDPERRKLVSDEACESILKSLKR